MKIFLVAGEPSGDRLGGALMAGLETLRPGISWTGIGGVEMTRRGLESRFPMEELSVMGLAEVIPRYRHLRRRLHQTIAAVIATDPDVLVTIDSPDFCLRVARGVKAARPDLRVVHYVAPTVWAWRPGRARKMRGIVDEVLAILPFEPPYMEAAGIACTFVGHPVVTEPVATAAQADAFRGREALGTAPTVLVLPGSRESEVGRLAPVFGAALERLAGQVDGLRVLVPAAASVVDAVIAAARDWPGEPVILDPRIGRPEVAAARKRAAFAAADVALAASGTVSLELAAAATPMVIAYDVHPVTWQIMHRMVRVDSVVLVNLVSETRVVPEFLGPRCRPGPIADAVATLLTDADARAGQAAAMRLTMDRLGRGGDAPGLRAARAVLEGLDGR